MKVRVSVTSEPPPPPPPQDMRRTRVKGAGTAAETRKCVFGRWWRLEMKPEGNLPTIGSCIDRNQLEVDQLRRRRWQFLWCDDVRRRDFFTHGRGGGFRLRRCCNKEQDKGRCSPLKQLERNGKSRRDFPPRFSHHARAAGNRSLRHLPQKYSASFPATLRRNGGQSRRSAAFPVESAF